MLGFAFHTCVTQHMATLSDTTARDDESEQEVADRVPGSQYDHTCM